MNITEILVLLLASVQVTIGDFEYCKEINGFTQRGKHEIVIQDDVIIKNEIQICRNATEKEWVLAHELGHQYWFVGLSLWEREEYRKLFENSKENDFYRDYSKTNVIEDFADNFALIVLKKAPNNKKIDFIKKSFD